MAGARSAGTRIACRHLARIGDGVSLHVILLHNLICIMKLLLMLLNMKVVQRGLIPHQNFAQYHQSSVGTDRCSSLDLKIHYLTEVFKVWEFDDGEDSDYLQTNIGPFTMIKDEFIEYHQVINENGIGKILRPGSLHQVVPHNTTTEEACYGDAGGSVWKYWMFRDESSIPDNRVQKLAILTGVVSR